MNELLAWVLIAPAAYLIGSIPVGVIVCRVWTGVDPREHGSGSMGATNVLRTAGKKAAALVFALDLGKGALVIALSLILAPESFMLHGIAGTFVIFGAHLASVCGVQRWERHFAWLGCAGGVVADRRRRHVDWRGDCAADTVRFARIDCWSVVRNLGVGRPRDRGYSNN